MKKAEGRNHWDLVSGTDSVLPEPVIGYSPPNIKPVLIVKGKPFCKTDEWLSLRYDALVKYGRRCCCCGVTSESAVMHVDHIKPKSLHPELALDINNLQILCKDCNFGKGNRDDTDLRY